MKKAILTLTLSFGLIIPSFMFAQDSDNDSKDFRSYKSHLSIGVEGAGELSGNLTALTSIGYKRYMNKGAIRGVIGANYRGSTTSESGTATYKDELIMLSTRVGYQYLPDLIFNRVGTSLGIDLVGGMYSNYNEGSISTYERSNMVVGISPNFGVEFYVIPKISILIETRFDMAINQLSISNQEYDFDGNLVSSYAINNNGYLTHISPIGLFHVAYHF